jgi:hypothetical protein
MKKFFQSEITAFKDIFVRGMSGLNDYIRVFIPLFIVAAILFAIFYKYLLQ